MNETDNADANGNEGIALNRTEWGTIEGIIRTLQHNFQQKTEAYEAIAQRLNRESLLVYQETNAGATLDDAKKHARQYTAQELETFDYDDRTKRLVIAEK